MNGKDRDRIQSVIKGRNYAKVLLDEQLITKNTYSTICIEMLDKLISVVENLAVQVSSDK